MPEWLMGADCKSASIAYVGSNPTRPKKDMINNFLNKLKINACNFNTFLSFFFYLKHFIFKIILQLRISPYTKLRAYTIIRLI